MTAPAYGYGDPVDPCPRTDRHDPHWHGQPGGETLCPGVRLPADPVPAAGEVQHTPPPTGDGHELLGMMAQAWDAAGHHPPRDWWWRCTCGESATGLRDQVAALDGWAAHRAAHRTAQ